MKWDQHQRFRLIELIAYWEGRLTTNHLCSSFGIGRQQASKDINFYIQHISSHNLRYDRSLKGYVPTDSFSPLFISGDAGEFLNLLASQESNQNIFAPMQFTGGIACSLPIPVRKVNAEHVRKVLLAAKNKLRLQIRYRSMNQPVTEERVIAPHSIICTPLRWHVRAYCEKNSEYRDFILSRFEGDLELLTSSSHTQEADEKWQEQVEIQLSPDPRLSQNQQAMIRDEYDMDSNIMPIICRSALTRYTLHALGVYLDYEHTIVGQQQLVVVNKDEVSSHL